MPLGEQPGDLSSKQPLERGVADERDGAERGRGGRHLGPDEPRSDHGQPGAGVQRGAKP